MIPPPESSNQTAGIRKQYESPRLEIYGNIHQITHAIGMHGKMDNATMMILNIKTG
jgi:hypothetical protein